MRRLQLKLNDDGYKDLGSFQMYFLYSPKERWMGIRNWRRVEKIEQKWENRTGEKQLYLLQLIPCLGFAFEITRWTPIKPEKKKK